MTYSAVTEPCEACANATANSAPSREVLVPLMVQILSGSGSSAPLGGQWRLQ